MAIDRQSIFQKSVNALFIVLALFNCVVIFIFERDRRPRVERVEVTITTNQVLVVTNFIESSVSTHAVVSTNVLESLVRPKYQVNYAYRYMVWNGRRYAAVNDFEFLSEGSPTSYGRIKFIYHDRIELENGVWLVNVHKQSDGNKDNRSDSRKEFVSRSLVAGNKKGGLK